MATEEQAKLVIMEDITKSTIKNLVNNIIKDLRDMEKALIEKNKEDFQVAEWSFRKLYNQFIKLASNILTRRA